MSNLISAEDEFLEFRQRTKIHMRLFGRIFDFYIKAPVIAKNAIQFTANSHHIQKTKPEIATQSTS